MKQRQSSNHSASACFDACARLGGWSGVLCLRCIVLTCHGLRKYAGVIFHVIDLIAAQHDARQLNSALHASIESAQTEHALRTSAPVPDGSGPRPGEQEAGAPGNLHTCLSECTGPGGLRLPHFSRR